LAYGEMPGAEFVPENERSDHAFFDRRQSAAHRKPAAKIARLWFEREHDGVLFVVTSGRRFIAGSDTHASSFMLSAEVSRQSPSSGVECASALKVPNA
jgi:hypothetical protein